MQVNNYSSLTGLDCADRLHRMKYGERLRAARIHAGLKQEGLAEKIGWLCTQENISKLERGEATGSEYTAQFAHACSVSPIWLAAETGDMLIIQYYDLGPQAAHVVKAMQESPEIVDALAKNADTLTEFAKRAKDG